MNTLTAVTVEPGVFDVLDADSRLVGRIEANASRSRYTVYVTGARVAARPTKADAVEAVVEHLALAPVPATVSL